MPKTQILTFLIFTFGFAVTTQAAVAVQIEDYASIPRAASGLSARMNLMTSDPNGRLFVNDQRGGLYTVDRQTRAVQRYFDLSDTSAFPAIQLTQNNNEAGFQSFAFHPDFYNSGTSGFGKFYTMHSSTNTTPTPDFNTGRGTSFHSVLLEWNTSNPSAATFEAADANAPFRELARFRQPFGNHNAGQIAFNTSVAAGDPDRGNLYVAIGDGGASNDPDGNSQNRSNPFGAVLRIDPLGNNSANGNYAIVADNAFASDNDSGTLAEVFSYGLRNPQRFGWDNLTGELYIADIGQNSFEEINQAVNGGNFGWQIREGSVGEVPPGLIDPVADYDHINGPSGFVQNPITGSRAITVGEVIRDGDIEALEGMLLLGDFPNGIIYTLDVDGQMTLDGGSDDLSELQLFDDAGNSVRLIDLIRDTTNANDGRADLRFSYSTGGDIFILNKRDNMIRRLVTAVPEPSALATLLGITAIVGSRPRRRRAKI